MRESIALIHESQLRNIVNNILSDTSVNKGARTKIRKLIKEVYEKSGGSSKILKIDELNLLTEFQVSLLTSDWIAVAPMVVESIYGDMSERFTLAQSLGDIDSILDDADMSHLKKSYASSRGRTVIIAILLCAGLKYVSARDLNTGKNVRRLKPMESCFMMSLEDHLSLLAHNLKRVSDIRQVDSLKIMADDMLKGLI